MTEPVTRPTLEGTTPGPWWAEPPSPNARLWTLYSEGEPNISVAHVWNKADARLIAQAPALAAENQKLREALERIAAECTMFVWGDVARAALASAAPLLTESKERTTPA